MIMSWLHGATCGYKTVIATRKHHASMLRTTKQCNFTISATREQCTCKNQQCTSIQNSTSMHASPIAHNLETNVFKGGTSKKAPHPAAHGRRAPRHPFHRLARTMQGAGKMRPGLGRLLALAEGVASCMALRPKPYVGLQRSIYVTCMQRWVRVLLRVYSTGLACRRYMKHSHTVQPTCTACEPPCQHEQSEVRMQLGCKFELIMALKLPSLLAPAVHEYLTPVYWSAGASYPSSGSRGTCLHATRRKGEANLAKTSNAQPRPQVHQAKLA